jgi:hypothetical protein
MDGCRIGVTQKDEIFKYNKMYYITMNNMGLSEEIERKFDLAATQMFGIAEQLLELIKIYRPLVEQQKAIVEEFKSFYEKDLIDVLDKVIRRISSIEQQRDVLHKKVMTPEAIRQNVMSKGLDSPTSLVYAILHGGAEPIEVLEALSLIREKNRKRWRS